MRGECPGAAKPYILIRVDPFHIRPERLILEPAGFRIEFVPRTVDVHVARGAPVHPGNPGKIEFVSQIGQNDLSDFYRRIDKIDHRQVSEHIGETGHEPRQFSPQVVFILAQRAPPGRQCLSLPGHFIDDLLLRRLFLLYRLFGQPELEYPDFHGLHFGLFLRRGFLVPGFGRVFILKLHHVVLRFFKLEPLIGAVPIGLRQPFQLTGRRVVLFLVRLDCGLDPGKFVLDCLQCVLIDVLLRQLDFRFGLVGLQRHCFLLKILPFPVVVVPDHPEHGENQNHAGHGENHVHSVYIVDEIYEALRLIHRTAPGWRRRTDVPRPPTPSNRTQDAAAAPATRANPQILKKYSGMATMYFRLNSQRSNILMGRATMQRKKKIITL